MSSVLPEIVPQERPRLGRRDLLVGVFGGLLGLVLGTALAVVTIILPWRAEVRRRMEPSPFVKTFSPLPILRQLVDSGVTWDEREAGNQGINPRSRRFHFVARNLDTNAQSRLLSDFQAQAGAASVP